MRATTAVPVSEYYSQLLASEVKLEYFDGEVVAMEGAQPSHVLIQSNLIFEFMNCLQAKGCSVFGSDLLVKVADCDSCYFPDLVIVCKNPEYEPTDTGLLALTNSEVVVEILSPNTEITDRIRKMDCYKTILSLKEYVLVSSTKKQVEVVRKISQAEWLHHTYTSQDKTLNINECELLFEDVYRKVDLAEHA